MYRQGFTSSFNTIAAVVVSAVFLLLPPASYGLVTYINLVAQMDREVELRGQVVNQAIATAPLLWAYQEVRFTELLSRQLYKLESGLLSIFDDKGGLVAAVGQAPDRPVVAREVPLVGAGAVAGRLVISHSLRPLMISIAWLFVLGVALAAVAFVTLRVIPLRALRRLNEDLRQRDVELAYANIVHTAAMEGSPDGMLVVSDKGNISSFNQRFATMWALPAALFDAPEIAPVQRAVASRAKDPAAFVARIKQLYDNPDESGQDRLELKDGRVFERHSRTLYDLGHKYLGRVWYFRDVTEREAQAETIRTSEEKFRTLVEATTDFIWALDGDGRYTYASPAVSELLGYAPEEVIGKSPLDLMPPSEAHHAAAQFAATMGAGSSFSAMERRVCRKDGAVIVVETSGVPILDVSGTFSGYRGIDRDITTRKGVEQALQRRDALLDAVATSAAELASARNLDEAMLKVMKQVGQTIGVDRIVVLEQPREPGHPPICQYGWDCADAWFGVNAEIPATGLFGSPDVMALMAPLRDGHVVSMDAASASGDVTTCLESLGVQAALLVPVTIDGKYWGHVSFDSRERQRRWEHFEIEILRTLTSLIGNAIQRERYVKQLRDAMRIIQDTPSILYRLSSGPPLAVNYVSQNIRLFGYEPEAFTSSPRLFMTIIHPDDLPRVRQALTVTLEADSQPGVLEQRMLTSRGGYRLVENRYAPVRDSRGRLIEIEGMLVDITERRAAEEKIALLARTDGLTGLANRTTFIERLRLAYSAAQRGAPAFAVLYIDLDRFKDINDSLGHPLGDLLLQTVAERLKSCIRGTDLVARPGGDEFAILQTDLKDSTGAGILAAKIGQALARPIQLEGNDLRVTASIGIAIYTPDINASDDMLVRADLALYRAKEEGRDQYRYHSEDLDERAREQVVIADELRTGLDRQEFELYYQPQVALASGRIVGMEALLRWNHPTRGQLHPQVFLPIAEKTGTMLAIGRWVIDRTCRQMRAWREAGIAPATVAVSVSLAELKTAGEFVQFIGSTLAKWDLPASTLELGVTESMLAHTTLANNDVIERLQISGIKVAIDDFGTKFSSLDYLRTFRVSRLKIARSMVDSATQHSGDAAMVRAITSIARELNVEVVAQGVESEAQWASLNAVTPATSVQGYFYSEPVPEARATQLLHEGAFKPAVHPVFLPV